MLIEPYDMLCEKNHVNLLDSNICYDCDSENIKGMSLNIKNIKRSEYYNTRKYYNRIIGLFSDK